MLSAPGFQCWLGSQKKENELAEKDSKCLFLQGKKKLFLRPLQLKDAIWGKDQNQKFINTPKKTAAGIREETLLYQHIVLENSACEEGDSGLATVISH